MTQAQTGSIYPALSGFQASKTVTKPRKLIQILGKRWFQQSYGNTYHSVKMWFDDDTTEYIDFEYGGDYHYIVTAFNACGMKRNGNEWDCQKLGIITQVIDVQRKKDL